VIFFHIQHTGGTSLLTVARRFYKPGEIVQVDIGMRGSLPKLAEEAKGKPFFHGHMFIGLHTLLPGHRYITLLRNPYARAISMFRRSEATDFLDCVQRMSTMTEMLCGPGGAATAERAFDNLGRHFDHVGFTDRLGETASYLRGLGWPVDEMPHENKGNKFPSPTAAELVEVARWPRMREDDRLYEMARGA
jgi:hypothetical protein